MKTRYVLESDEIFKAEILEQHGSVVILEDMNGTVVRHSTSDVFLTELDAKIALRSHIQEVVQLEHRNVKSATTRLENATSRLNKLNFEIFNITHK